MVQSHPNSSHVQHKLLLLGLRHLVGRVATMGSNLVFELQYLGMSVLQLQMTMW